MKQTTAQLIQTGQGASRSVATVQAWIAALCFIVMVGMASSAHANQGFAQMLAGEIQVEGQSRNERQQVLPRIFSDVLVRVTGNPAVLENAQVRSELRNVNDYLLQFGYQSSDEGLTLIASFDETRIRQLLQRAGFPLWTGQRPQLLLWLAEDDPTRGVRLVGRTEERDFIKAFQRETRRRGIQILMPLLDLQDQMAITPRDVWGRFEQEIAAASARYPVEGVISARLFQMEPDGDTTVLLSGESTGSAFSNDADEQSNLYVLEAGINIGDLRFVEVIEAESEAEVAERFVNQVVDRIAQVFIGESEDGNADIIVRFRGVNQLSQVLQAEQLLQQQGQVYRVQLRRYQQGTADFAVQLNGGARWLSQALEFERRIERTDLNLEADAAEQEVALEFRWVR